MFSMFPAIASATTLSEWKAGKRLKFDDMDIDLPTGINVGDEDVIGKAIIGAEGLAIRETNL